MIDLRSDSNQSASFLTRKCIYDANLQDRKNGLKTGTRTDSDPLAHAYDLILLPGWPSYEYGPFGETIQERYVSNEVRQSLGEGGFRFNSKYQDEETRLYYYGYRFYDAQTGRFLNRDPIEEFGGLNIYGFVGNDTANRLDYLGLKTDEEKAQDFTFAMISTFGGVRNKLQVDLLRTWIYGDKSDYQLSKDDFVEFVFKDTSLKEVLDNQFDKDLKKHCSKSAASFKGDYLIKSYAKTGRTLGNYFTTVSVEVECKCPEDDHVFPAFFAKGKLNIAAPEVYDYNKANRPIIDEIQVAMVRIWGKVFSVGKDFEIKMDDISFHENGNGKVYGGMKID